MTPHQPDHREALRDVERVIQDRREFFDEERESDERRGVTLDFIPPWHLVETCSGERFNRRLRNDWLNLNHFRALAKARIAIEAWRAK